MHKAIRAEKWTIMILVQFLVCFFFLVGFGGEGSGRDCCSPLAAITHLRLGISGNGSQQQSLSFQS
jgi:hypothetical protein